MAAAPSLSQEIQRGLIDPAGEGLSKTKLARSALNTAWGNFIATTASPDVSIVERDRLLYQILYHVIDILQGHDPETQRAEIQSSENKQNRTGQYHTFCQLPRVALTLTKVSLSQRVDRH